MLPTLASMRKMTIYDDEDDDDVAEEEKSKNFIEMCNKMLIIKNGNDAIPKHFQVQLHYKNSRC